MVTDRFLTFRSVSAAAMLAAGLVIGLVTTSSGADQLAEQSALEQQAGPDFAIQGEYVGTVGDEKLGAQVVALGNGSFRAAFLTGGLPGQGWNGKPRVRITGTTLGPETRLGTAGEGWTAVLVGAELDGRTGDGREFHLKKVLRESPRSGAEPPPGATILFNGKSAEAFTGGKISPDGLLQVGATTRKSYTDFRLHVEFRLPFMPTARGQSRANSGVYLQKRYEIQVLDSFGTDGVKNECGAVYTRIAPSVNMCFPPLSWQTYDIDFQAARWDANGQKTKDAVVSVNHNGVTAQDHVEIAGPTGHGDMEAPTPGPIYLQNHGSPVMFRNVWLVEGRDGK